MYGVHRTCPETATISRGPNRATNKQRCQYTISFDIGKIRYIKNNKKLQRGGGYSHSFKITCNMSAVCSMVENSAEYKRSKRMINNKTSVLQPGAVCVCVWGGGGGVIKGQPIEGGSRAGMPKCKPSIVTKHLYDKPKSSCLLTLAHTTATCLEGLCCKAYRWPTAKLGIWEHSTMK